MGIGPPLPTGRWGAPTASQSILIDGNSSQNSTVSVVTTKTIADLQIDAGDTLAVTYPTNTGQTLNYTGSSLFNAGTLKLGTATSPIVFTFLSQPVTFMGGGTVAMAGTSLRAGRVINLDNTFTGSGAFGVFGAGMLNHATLSANNSGIITLFSNDAIPMQNRGVITAANGSYIVFTGQLGEQFDNTNGLVRGVGNAIIQLDHGAILSGGTLQNGSAWTTVQGNDYGGLRDIFTSGDVQVYGISTLSLGGQITNTGRMYTGAFDQQINTFEVIADGVTLNGGGSLRLNPYGKLIGPGTLTNNGNTILGAGQVGANSLAIENRTGIIQADVTASTMTVDPKPLSVMLNAATMQAINGATLTLSGNGGGTFRNTGAIIANGGVVSTTAGAVINSISQNTLLEGTWSVLASSTILLQSTDIRTNQATISLAGQAASFPAISQISLNSGTFSLKSGADFNDSNSFTNAGSLSLGDGCDFNTVGNLTLHSTGLFETTVNDSGAEQFGQLHASGTLTLSGSLRVTLDGPFAPVQGQSFLIADGSSRIGQFDQLILPTLSNGLYFSPSYTPTGVYLQVLVPEPVTPLGITVALIAFATRVRRTSAGALS